MTPEIIILKPTLIMPIIVRTSFIGFWRSYAKLKIILTRRKGQNIRAFILQCQNKKIYI